MPRGAPSFPFLGDTAGWCKGRWHPQALNVFSSDGESSLCVGQFLPPELRGGSWLPADTHSQFPSFPAHARTASGPGLREICQMYHSPGPQPCRRLEGSSSLSPACLVVPLAARSVCYPGSSRHPASKAPKEPEEDERDPCGGENEEPCVPPTGLSILKFVWILPSLSLCIFCSLYHQCPPPSLTVELLFILKGPMQKNPLADPSCPRAYLCHGTYHRES